MQLTLKCEVAEEDSIVLRVTGKSLACRTVNVSKKQREVTAAGTIASKAIPTLIAALRAPTAIDKCGPNRVNVRKGSRICYRYDAFNDLVLMMSHRCGDREYGGCYLSTYVNEADVPRLLAFLEEAYQELTASPGPSPAFGL